MSSSIIDKLTQEEIASLTVFKGDDVHNNRIGIFQMVMAIGNLEIIKLMKELLDISPEELCSINIFELNIRPSKELVQWWVETCEPSKADLIKLIERLLIMWW